MQAWRTSLMQAWSGQGKAWWGLSLWPMSLVYAGLLSLRWTLYQIGWLRRHRLPVPVIVVGNVLVGGVGKTPITIALVKHLSSQGWRVGVLSRGYGRSANAAPLQEVQAQSTPEEVGDEPLLIHRQCGVPVWVGADRALAGRALLARYPEVQVLVCDDGLQHWALARDLELCVFDDRGPGNGHLLPSGPLREPWPRRLRQPDVPQWVLQSSPTTLPEAYGVQRQLSPMAHQANGQSRPLQSWQSTPVQALAGIAKPEVFFQQLQDQGLQLRRTLALPDHAELKTLPLDPAQGEVLCTEKDAVKLWRHHPEAWAVALQTTLPRALLDAIDQHLACTHPQKLSSPHGHQTA